MNEQNMVIARPEPQQQALVLSRPVMVGGPRESKQELTWGQLFGILKRNRWLSLGILVTVMLLAGLITIMQKPKYSATAQIQIDPPSSESFSLRDGANVTPIDPDYLTTQAEIIRSDDMLLMVIRELKLDENPDIVLQNKPGPIDAVLHAIRSLIPKRSKPHFGNAGDSGGPVLSDSEKTALANLQKNLEDHIARNSNIVDVTFTSLNPWLAAKVTNTLASLYLEQNYKTRYETTMQATQWLSRQLDDLHQRLDKSNQALSDFQNQNGIVDLNDRENTTTQTVQQLTQLLNTAKGERIELEAKVRTLNESGVDALADTRSSLLIQDLSRMLADESANLAQSQVIYGDDNANVRKYQNQVTEVKRQLQAERDRIEKSVRAAYRASVAREQLVGSTLDSMRDKIHEMNQTEIENDTLKKRVSVDEDLYNSLFKKLKEAGIEAGLRSSTIRIVDQARVDDKPVKPQPMVNMGLGFILALVCAVGAPLLREMMADKIHSPGDIRSLTGVSPIGVMPVLDLPKPRPVLVSSAGLQPAPRTPREAATVESVLSGNPLGAEAVRSLVTSIKLCRPQKPPRIILVSSALPGEGKTTVAVSLARMLAESHSTCVLDGDLRKPSVAQMFGLKAEQGLGDVLNGNVDLDSVLRPAAGVKKLTVMPGGAATANPGELVSSETMRETVRELAERFQYVVIDSPPLVPFADGRAMSRLVDGVLVVGRAGSTGSEELSSALELLNDVHAPVLGIVLNGVEKSSAYYRRYRSSFYAYAARA